MRLVSMYRNRSEYNSGSRFMASGDDLSPEQADDAASFRQVNNYPVQTVVALEQFR